MKKHLMSAVVLIISGVGVLAQEQLLKPYAPPKSALESSERQLTPSRASYYRLTSPEELIARLKGNPDLGSALIRLPAPDGQSHTFVLTPFRMVHPSIRRAYPEMLTARGYDRDRPWVSVAVDWTPMGFHASVRNGKEGRWYIAPLFPGNQQAYQSFYTRDVPVHSEDFISCITEEHDELIDIHRGFNPKSIGDCQLREYQLALACTGEYASFHGNNDAAVFGEMVTAINRVNQILGQDLSVQLTLANKMDMAGNIDLVYNDPATDPYTNGDLSSLIDENQATCDVVIGPTNYDIGHVFTTTGGGIATVFSTCQNGFKARGASGLNNPVGDPFYVDFVVHEMGHQFGARHSFNSSTGNCVQRNGPTAYEPGGGTTIMAYAGICGPTANIQFTTDDYFHGGSLFNIANYLELGFGSSCASILSTSNTEPTVSAGTDFSIPTNTPFVLTASASDANDDFLTYCWEASDLGPTVDGLPTGTETESPLFRSRPPTTEPERYFPRLSDLTNGTVDWEVLPLVTRELSFVVTVRDLHPDGGTVYGCPVQDAMTVNVINTGAQFGVLDPNGGERWQAGSTQMVSWNVAGTNGNGINCANVDVVLSTDGGLSYDQVLASGVPNNGLSSVMVPMLTETDARVMVRCSDNIFFDISDANFSIEQNDYDYRIINNVGTACDGADVVSDYGFILESLQGYTGTVNLSTIGLPGGVSVGFSANPVVLSSDAQVSVNLGLSGIASLPAGSYPFIVRANDGSTTKDQSYSLVVKPLLASAELVSPADGGFLDPEAALFDWEPVPTATSYEWRMYSNPSGTGGFQFATTSNSVLNFGPMLPVNEGDVRYWGIIAFDDDCNPVDQSVSPLFKVQFGTAPVLPVEWLAFQAAPRGKSAQLSWTVRQDEAHVGFTVQRRESPSSAWEDIGWVSAAPGEATAHHQYTDRAVQDGGTYYYRLQQEDQDGQTSFSPIRGVSFGASSRPGIFPNPAKDVATLRGATQFDRYEVYDARGRLMTGGSILDGRAAINLFDFPQGIYQVRLSSANDAVVVRVIKP